VTAPSYSKIEQAIRLAWSGDAAEARAAIAEVGADLNDELVAKLELLAAAPFAYKNAQADAVRGAWVRAGGVTPVVARTSISDPVTTRLPAI
jgi:hypothetical protein